MVDSQIFTHYLKLAQEFYDEQNICEIFSEFVEIILKNGIESEENQNMWNNIIIKNLNEFLKSKLKYLSKTNICMNNTATGFNNILKSFFIPGMLLFNNFYENNKKSNNNYLISCSIIKYFVKDQEEKLGGTMKYINTHYIKKINNYNEIINMKIDNINSVFLLEFIELFFINNKSEYLWDFIKNIFSVDEDFTKEKFISSIIKDSYDEINSKFLSYLKYKLYIPSLEEIKIFIDFLTNFANILLNELYPSKLIYLIPVKIILSFISLINCILDILINLSNSNNDILDYSKSYQNEKQTYIKEIIKLSENCVKQYVSFLSKIISDKNVKITYLKCHVFKVLQALLAKEQFFTDEEVLCFLNFINEIYNDEIYKTEVFNFTKIFNNKLKQSDNSFTKLGSRLYKIFKQKDNNNILRIILILLYNNINSSLSNLEENLAEFRQNINDNNNGFSALSINNAFSNIINEDNLNNHNLDINNINSNNVNNNSQLIVKNKKLKKLKNYLKDANNHFIKLKHFYSLCSDIFELYDFGSFENKFLDNLLLSIYNIIFSSFNSGKKKDNKLVETYKKLIITILTFYTTIFKNISLINKENIMKELSKRRNVYHFKDIGNFLNNYNELKKDKYINDKIKYFNDFLTSLEIIIPEKDTIKLNNNNNDESLENNNLCPICVDSVANAHLLPCQHLICKNCYLQCLSGNKLCPFCRIKIKGIKEDKKY